jgi:hypothetical protein
MAQDGIGGGANIFSLESAIDEPEKCFISDEHFIRDLKRLKDLRSFLIQEAINISPGDSAPLSFGRLNLLQYRPDGRSPTQQEWSEVELQTQTLFRLLTEPLRRRFILGEIPSWISILPILLALLALAGLIGAIVVQRIDFLHLKTISANTLPFYLVWLMSLGAIGAVAFIGMNALSVQQDITFDRRLMLLRITLGALFGLVLTLPFGFNGFMEFVSGISSESLPQDMIPARTITVTTQALLLLLPFVLGFSTSLVIMILNRLVEGVQAFFGKTGLGERGQVSSSTEQSSPSPRAVR